MYGEVCVRLFHHKRRSPSPDHTQCILSPSATGLRVVGLGALLLRVVVAVALLVSGACGLDCASSLEVMLCCASRSLGQSFARLFRSSVSVLFLWLCVFFVCLCLQCEQTA